MAWIGKIIGGTVGLFIGGPLGMVAGAAFGHMIDRSQDIGEQQRTDDQGRFRVFTRSGPSMPFGGDPQYQAQLVFFVGTFSMLAKLAMADGSVSEHERRKVIEFIDQDLHLIGESRDAALRIFEAAVREGGSFEEFAFQYYQQFRHDRNMLELAVDILYRVGMADGSMTASEQQLIFSAVRIFQIPPSIIDVLKSRYASAGKVKKRSYAVLGVSPSAGNDEIKRAYRKMVSDYHPDKIAAKGLPDEFINFAQEKFRSIQSAYEEIRKERGF